MVGMSEEDRPPYLALILGAVFVAGTFYLAATDDDSPEGPPPAPNGEYEYEWGK